MKTGFKIELNVKQAGDIMELLNKVQGAHDALRSLVKAGYQLKDLKLGEYGSSIDARVTTDIIYEPGDVKHNFSKNCSRIDEFGTEQSINHVEYTARMLAKVTKAFIKEEPELEGTAIVLEKAETETELPSDIKNVISTEFIDYDEAKALRIISEDTPETWIVTGKGVAVLESKGD